MIDYSLYVITDQHLQGNRTADQVVEEAIRGGATVIQLREKTAHSRHFLEQALLLQTITQKAGISLIINDRIDIALASGADGVHLGDEDLPIEYAREIAQKLIIGYSADSVETARWAESQGANYLGVGSVYATSTKSDAGFPIGLQRLKEIKQAVSIPVVAIGGITLNRLNEVLATGVDGVAVVSAIVAAPSVYAATRQFRNIIDNYRMRTTCQP